MTDNKFPYVNCNERELNLMEEHYFLIMGGDFVSRKDIVMFTKREMAHLYNKTLDNLMKIVEGENPKEREFAISLIGSLRIVPVRIH